MPSRPVARGARAGPASTLRRVPSSSGSCCSRTTNSLTRSSNSTRSSWFGSSLTDCSSDPNPSARRSNRRSSTAPGNHHGDRSPNRSRSDSRWSSRYWCDRAQHRVEQLLMPAIGRGEAEHTARERRELHVLDRAADLGVDELVHVFLADEVGEADDDLGRASRAPSRVLRDDEPVGNARDRVRRAHPFADRVRRQEVLLYELAEGVAELVLALLDHRRVRDRDAERVTEQRRHREPVGQASDERRLQPGAEVSGPARVIGEEHRREERGPHDQEEPRRPPLAGAQELRAAGLALKGRRSDGGRCGRGGDVRHIAPSYPLARRADGTPTCSAPVRRPTAPSTCRGRGARGGSTDDRHAPAVGVRARPSSTRRGTARAGARRGSTACPTGCATDHRSATSRPARARFLEREPPRDAHPPIARRRRATSRACRPTAPAGDRSCG